MNPGKNEAKTSRIGEEGQKCQKKPVLSRGGAAAKMDGGSS